MNGDIAILIGTIAGGTALARRVGTEGGAIDRGRRKRTDVEGGPALLLMTGGGGVLVLRTKEGGDTAETGSGLAPRTTIGPGEGIAPRAMIEGEGGRALRPRTIEGEGGRALPVKNGVVEGAGKRDLTTGGKGTDLRIPETQTGAGIGKGRCSGKGKGMEEEMGMDRKQVRERKSQWMRV